MTALRARRVRAWPPLPSWGLRPLTPVAMLVRLLLSNCECYSQPERAAQRRQAMATTQSPIGASVPAGMSAEAARPQRRPAMTTFLPPIEKPRGLIMKMVYFFSRRQFGKVMTPIKVHSARMPLAFGSFYGKLPRLDKKLQLPSQTALLIREQVASTNMCMFCMDAARCYVMTKTPGDLARLDALPQYQTSPLFTDAQRAALDYATELTRDRK